jgi:hypothetical protein
MEQDLAAYNKQEYQSKEIEVLCKRLLDVGEVEYSLDEMKSDLNQSHVKAYNFLRIALRTFEEQTKLLIKALNVEPPRGGIHWVLAQR